MKTATITETPKRATASRRAAYYRGVRVPVTRGEGRFSREEIQRAVERAFANFTEDHGGRG